MLVVWTCKQTVSATLESMGDKSVSCYKVDENTKEDEPQSRPEHHVPRVRFISVYNLYAAGDRTQGSVHIRQVLSHQVPSSAINYYAYFLRLLSQNPAIQWLEALQIHYLQLWRSEVCTGFLDKKTKVMVRPCVLEAPGGESIPFAFFSV